MPEALHGLYWLHCDGPDGPVVLLGKCDGWTGLVTLVDDGCTAYPLDGNRLHKWEVYAVEPAHRPPPKPRPE